MDREVVINNENLNVYNSTDTSATPSAGGALEQQLHGPRAGQKFYTNNVCCSVPVKNTQNSVNLLLTKKMLSSFCRGVAASLEHDLSEPTSVPDDRREAEGCPQSVSDSPAYSIRAAGVLRYSRESDSHWTDVTTIPPTLLSDYPMKCEYCGEEAKPSLDLTWIQLSETAPLFCCGRWQQLCEMLVQHECNLRTSSSLGHAPAGDTEELLFRGRGKEKGSKFNMDLPSRLGEQSEQELGEDYFIKLPAAKLISPTAKLLRFRLSGPPEGPWTLHPSFAAEKHLAAEEEQLLVPFCDHRPLQFGICHLQDRSEFLQKNYSSGLKFLIVFPDGSAQVYYPSGLLAIVVMVTGKYGRICIVYDDSDAPSQPVRAIFQSDGKATCYHSNGNIWLSLTRSGGQCLDEEGARVCRWSWSSHSLTPTPLHPIFLSLNKAVGVRVLGREKVFVSFLAKGQQAKFSVGPCCTQGECKPDVAASGPRVFKEELFVLAARIRIQLAFQLLHQYLMTPSHPLLPKLTPTPHFHVAAQKLQRVSADVMMSESDRAFIQRCLQDCL